ncbi:MAG: hypothetical protein H0T46_17215 [Deltaproteobacteria bacterium]|nr:hypothetical protein [Deltaproteobacteria bacterium]
MTSKHRKRSAEPAHFLNVDLEIGSRMSLAPLSAELSANRNVFELFVGRVRGLARAHYEVHSRNHTADTIARDLVRLVESLSPQARKCWDRASVRDFNVGIQSSTIATPHLLELPLEAKTVAAIAELGGRIVVTVYAPPS